MLNVLIKHQVNYRNIISIEFPDRSMRWYNNDGYLHREDGPAIEFYNGDKEWWINGKQIYCKDNKEFQRIMKMKALL